MGVVSCEVLARNIVAGSSYLPRMYLWPPSSAHLRHFYRPYSAAPQDAAASLQALSFRRTQPRASPAQERKCPMNTQTCLRRPSLAPVILTACFAFSVVAPLVTFADPAPPQIPHVLESSVSLSDLDLSTPEGVRAAHKRLRGKAEYLCRQLWDGVTTTYRWTYAECVKKTVADAIQRLDGPALSVADQIRAAP